MLSGVGWNTFYKLTLNTAFYETISFTIELKVTFKPDFDASMLDASTLHCWYVIRGLDWYLDVDGVDANIVVEFVVENNSRGGLCNARWASSSGNNNIVFCRMYTIHTVFVKDIFNFVMRIMNWHKLRLRVRSNRITNGCSFPQILDSAQTNMIEMFSWAEKLLITSESSSKAEGSD